MVTAQNNFVSFAVILPSNAGIIGLQSRAWTFLQVYSERVVTGNHRLQEACRRGRRKLIGWSNSSREAKHNHSKSVQVKKRQPHKHLWTMPYMHPGETCSSLNRTRGDAPALAMLLYEFIQLFPLICHPSALRLSRAMCAQRPPPFLKSKSRVLQVL